MRLKKVLIASLRVILTNIRLGVGKMAHGNKLRFSPVTCLALSDSITLAKGSSINLGHRLHTRGRCMLSSQETGTLLFGENVFLNSGCMFYCRSSIEVGDGCEFGPNVLVYDHDHDFRSPGGIKDGMYKTAPVSIGKNCWIGAGTIILRGTKLGDGCVVGAGSIIKGEYPDNSVVVQKRSTETRDLNESLEEGRR